MICSAEWVLFAPVGDDWMVRRTVRGLRFAHPRLSIVRRLRRRMLEQARCPRVTLRSPAVKHSSPPSATHVGAVFAVRGLRFADARSPAVYMIYGAEWVLFAPVGDDWMVRRTVRGLRFAHPRRKHGSPPSATHVRAGSLSAGYASLTRG